jgi:hypothetical protein
MLICFDLYSASGVAVTLPALIPEDWGKGKDSSSIMLQRCLMPMHIGPCRMSLEKFYYDAEKKDCLLFFYGGCKVIRNLINFVTGFLLDEFNILQGNSNQFDTVEECRQTCRVKSEDVAKPTTAIQQPDQDIASKLHIP